MGLSGTHCPSLRSPEEVGRAVCSAVSCWEGVHVGPKMEPGVMADVEGDAEAGPVKE